jgi:oxygen-independent coproporphyrinogen-3 oxidase
MLLTGTGAVRFANTSDLDEYLGSAATTTFRILESAWNPATPEFNVIGRDEAFEESLFLGLRLNEGVDLHHLRNQFGDALLDDAMPALREVRDAGLLELNSDRMRLTPHGRLISNEVFNRLLISSAA